MKTLRIIIIDFFSDSMRYSATRTDLISGFLALISIGFFSSCKKFVEVPAPKNELVAENVFSNNATAIAAQNNSYTGMSSTSFDYSLMLGFSADELTNFNQDPSYNAVYTNTLTSTNPLANQLWDEGYRYIYNSNAVLNGLQKYQGVSLTVKRQLMGEAKFTRAFWNFYLTNAFGDIPLISTTDYQSNSVARRTSKDQVYQYVITELNDAKSLLSSDFLGSDLISVSTDRVRPSKWAALALLARVYLFKGDYKNAEAMADSVINNTNEFQLSADLGSVFLANSTEAIWQLEPPANQTGYNTTEGINFILSSTPSLAALSPSLINQFESGDKRLSSWVGSFNDGANNFYFPYKYKVQLSTTIIENTMVLRLAEQYLIRAEARAQQGADLVGAADDLNFIRNRAGLQNTAADTRSTLLAAIFRERQVELFTEWGTRWFDIKRLSIVDSVMNIASPLKNATWQSFQQLYPIPQLERQNDPNLTQNSGY